jgi:hypothetical protein
VRRIDGFQSLNAECKPEILFPKLFDTMDSEGDANVGFNKVRDFEDYYYKDITN